MSPESASAKATHRASSMAKGTSLLKRVAILALRTFFQDFEEQIPRN